MMIVGDFNATSDTYDALKDRILEGRLVDLGACDWPSTPVATSTCQAHETCPRTRRDALVVTPGLTAPVKAFLVHRDCMFPFHDVLQVVLSTKTVPQLGRVVAPADL